MGWVHERIDFPFTSDAVIPTIDPGEQLQKLIAGNFPPPEHEQPLYYLCLGPLSTIAHAVGTNPQLSRQISHLYFSGTGPTLEPSWNRLCDPDAFEAVLEGPWKFAAFARPNPEEPALSEEFLGKVKRIDTQRKQEEGSFSLNSYSWDRRRLGRLLPYPS
jgi:hypothetical protein